MAKFRFIIGMRVNIDDENGHPLKQRIRRIGEQITAITGADGVTADGTNLKELCDRMDEVLQLLRRAKASNHQEDPHDT